MKKLPVAALLCVISGALSAQQLRVVNAASLSEVTVAPSSIITIFGTKLAQGVAAAPDAAKPPANLGGVTVSIGGAAASLFYVSPTQINAVVNPATPLGSEAVIVTSSSGIQNGTVTVGNDGPPGLFSLFGSGTRDGAILNAVTFLLGDFSTRTAGSSTYLALFATGLAGTPTVTIGGVPVTVTFSGAAPCCAGLQQINVMLPDTLAGAGRVPVVATVNGHASNTVEVVLLPPATAKQFSNDSENQTRSRELASLATVPNTSLALSTDQNDDVVRVIDLSAKTVAHVIALRKGANPIGVAVTADGALAVVAESGTGTVAVVDLKTFTVKPEIAAGAGASRVAVVGTQAVVVNRDADTVTIVDLTAGTAIQTLPVGRGPANVAADAANHIAYVTNENDGTISVINLGTLAVTKTIALGASVRPSGITLLPGVAVAFVTAPGNGPDGALYTVNLTAGTATSMAANPDRSGGSSDLTYFNGKLYLANQAGGSISVLPVNATTGAATGAVTTIKVDLGARALAIDAKDGLLVVSNEGAGTLVLVSLTSSSVVGRVDAVRSSGDDTEDDHSDRAKAANSPVILTIAPATGKAGTTFTMTITGTNFTGATGLSFGNGNGNGTGNGHGNARDDDFTVKNVAVNSAGTQLTATVSIDSSAKPGGREVSVTTPNGESTDKGVGAAIFKVIP
jgi:uncharacterized protein (TIGR03437 family)